ncbi:MAG: hypothetical protein NZT61_02785 [Deltaproteobacteria bacterium]|nr:hypothetical protein [Deltaproteobacteria bacterium]MCX7952700.1 hypothetical protein [Deltaproteobacteria bacterium]
MKTFIFVLSFIFGGYFVLEFFLPTQAKAELGFDGFTPLFLDFVTIISSMAFGLGIINLFSIHFQKITLGLKGKFYSFVLLLSLCFTLVSGIWHFASVESLNLRLKFLEKMTQGDVNQKLAQLFPSFYKTLVSICPELDKACIAREKENVKSRIKDSDKHFSKLIFDFLTNAIFLPLGAAMFSLLAFFIASASFRAFQFKNIFGFLLLLSAVIVILGQNSFWTQLFPWFVELRAWLLNNVSSAVFRAIAIGSIIGGLIFSIRIWLGLEGVGK